MSASVSMSMSVSVSLSLSVYIFVCSIERKREHQRNGERAKSREREKEEHKCWIVFFNIHADWMVHQYVSTKIPFLNTRNSCRPLHGPNFITNLIFFTIQ